MEVEEREIGSSCLERESEVAKHFYAICCAFERNSGFPKPNFSTLLMLKYSCEV